MGYNTVVKIINDGWDQIRKNPDDFVDGIDEAINDGGEFRCGR